MSDSDFFLQSHDDELALRAQELLDHLLDKTIGESEARELREIWARLPRTENYAKDQFRIERLLRQSCDRQATLSTEKWNELDAFCRKRLGLAPRDKRLPRPDPQRFSDFRQATFSNLFAELPGSSHADADDPVAKSISIAQRAQKPAPTKKEGLKLFHVALFAILFAVFSLGVYSEFFLPSSSKTAVGGFRPIARIEAVVDVRWKNEEESFKEGQQLGTEAVRFDEGIVQLAFPNGIRIAVKGPADFRLNTRKKMFFGAGRLSATVPPAGRGFEVATPFLSVVDLGTEFLLEAQGNKIEAHTIRGKIELSGVEEKKIELNGGEALRLDTTGTFSRFEAEPSRFLTDLFVRGLRNMRDEKQLDFWNRHRRSIQQMPGLRLFYDFEEDDELVVNHAQPFESGRLRGADRCQGRWNRKKGCSFRRKNDAVEMTLSRKMTSATLWTSFRLDSFSQFNHVLLGSRGNDAGNFVWQIFSDGSVQLAVRPEKGAYPVLHRTPPVFQANRCGAWYQLATVLDASKKEMRTYLDGRLLDVSSLPSAVPLNLGEATLGNWLPAKKTATVSCLNGRIDQLMIFDRPLTDEDVRQLSLTYSQSQKENEP